MDLQKKLFSSDLKPGLSKEDVLKSRAAIAVLVIYIIKEDEEKTHPTLFDLTTAVLKKVTYYAQKDVFTYKKDFVATSKDMTQEEKETISKELKEIQHVVFVTICFWFKDFYSPQEEFTIPSTLPKKVQDRIEKELVSSFNDERDFNDAFASMVFNTDITK